MVMIEKKVYSERELLDRMVKRKIEIELLKELKHDSKKTEDEFEFYKKRYNELKAKQ
jgi:hypothetical protein